MCLLEIRINIYIFFGFGYLLILWSFFFWWILFLDVGWVVGFSFVTACIRMCIYSFVYLYKDSRVWLVRSGFWIKVTMVVLCLLLFSRVSIFLLFS